MTDLCLRSKAVHGYDPDFIAASRHELAVSASSVARGPAQVALAHQGLPVAYCQVIADRRECWLEALFVDPSIIGTGVGRRLFLWSVEAARALGAARMEIASDSGAAAFYRAMGAVDAGEVASGSIPGRKLPRLLMAV